MRISCVGFCVFLVAASVAHAQITEPAGRQPVPRAPSVDVSRFALGFALQRALPQGSLRANVGKGNGGSAFVSYNLDPAGNVALRAELTLFNHQERLSDLLIARSSSEFYDQVTVLTSSNSSSVGVGAQFSRQLGFLRPNLVVSYSRVKFESESYANSALRPRVIYGASNSDVTYAWSAGGGVDISPDAKSLVTLALGARYTFGGKGTWLHDSDIAPTGTDSYDLNPSRGNIEYLSIAFGVRIDVIRMLQR